MRSACTVRAAVASPSATGLSPGGSRSSNGTLAKAFGVIGGYIAGSADHVRRRAQLRLRPSSSRPRVPPAVAAGALASVSSYLKQPNQELRDRHQERAASPQAGLFLDGAGMPLHAHSVSHIVPVMVGDPVLCKQISDRLMDEFGFYVQPINYPTVPRGTERLRFTPSPLHSEEDIAALVSALSVIWASVGLKTAAA